MTARALWRRFDALVQRRPLLTKCGVYCGLLTGADLAGQAFQGARTLDDVDWREVARMASYGCVVAAPMVHNWFRFTTRMFGEPARLGVGAMTASSLGLAGRKIVFEQSVMSPVVISIAFAWNGLWRGDTPAQIAAKVRQDLVETWGNCAMVWGSVGLVNYTCVPLHMRTMVTAVVSAGWNTYLSMMAQRKLRPPAHTHPSDGDGEVGPRAGAGAG